MFGFSYTEGGPWSEDGIKAIVKFLDRIERLVVKYKDIKSKETIIGKDEKELLYATNYAIKNVDKDMEAFSFNTAVARLMELLNALYKYDGLEKQNVTLFKECLTKFLLLLAPCAPHFTEELWEISGNKKSVFYSEYPICDEKCLVLDEVEIAVQINSKIKTKIMIPSSATNEEIEKIVLSDDKVSAEVNGKEIKKVIIIPKRLVNILVNIIV